MANPSDNPHINFKLEDDETLMLFECKKWFKIHNNNDMLRFALSYTFHGVLREKKELNQE